LKSCLVKHLPNPLAQPRVPNLSFITLLSYAADLKNVGLGFELGSSVPDYQNIVPFGMPARSSSAYDGI
jgi:hypothetical protein